jgi:hypothetical protein
MLCPQGITMYRKITIVRDDGVAHDYLNVIDSEDPKICHFVRYPANSGQQMQTIDVALDKNTMRASITKILNMLDSKEYIQVIVTPNAQVTMAAGQPALLGRPKRYTYDLRVMRTDQEALFDFKSKCVQLMRNPVSTAKE